MQIELTRAQILALISAGVEIQAGIGDGWKHQEWQALSRAIEILKRKLFTCKKAVQ
jgi:hypothetical protein